MSGPSAAPSDTVQPQKTGEQCNEPSRRTWIAATSLPAITAFSCDTIFDLTPSDLVQVSAGLASRGLGGKRVGCRLCLQKSQKENEHFRFNFSPFGNSFPAASEKDSRQTDITGDLSPFSSPVVEFICSWIILDAACLVSYWLFSSCSENSHPEPWWNNEGGLQPQRSGMYNSVHAILHL